MIRDRTETAGRIRAFGECRRLECRQNGNPKIKPGPNGPGLASNFGRSGRIRTPDHWFWSLPAVVRPRPSSYVYVPMC